MIFIIYISMFSFASGLFLEESRYAEVKKIAYLQKNNYIKKNKEIEQIKKDLYMKNMKVKTQSIKIDMLEEKLFQSTRKQQEAEKKIILYKKIANPTRIIDGIKINNFKIFKNKQGQDSFSILMTQINLDKKHIKGTYSVKLIGKQEGQKKEIELNKITISGGNKFQFNFKYFQEIEGVLQLPQKFSLLRAQLKITSKKQNKVQIIEAKDIVY